jgi:putative transposase
MVVLRQKKIQPRRANDAWSMDFVSDQLAGGAKFRALTIVDAYTKEALAIQVGQRLRAEDVIAVLNRSAAQRGAPRYLFVDNGSEFSGPAAGSVGLSSPVPYRLQPTGQTHGQLPHRNLQRIVPR